MDTASTNSIENAGNWQMSDKDIRIRNLELELAKAHEDLEITNKKLAEVNLEMANLAKQVKEEKQYAQGIVETIRNPLLVLDNELRVKSANDAYYQNFHTTHSDTKDKLIYELGNNQWSIAELKTLLEKIIPEKSRVNDFEVTQTFSSLGERILMLNALELVKESNSEKLILLTIDDITEQRKGAAEKEVRKHFQFITDAMPQKVWTADAEGKIIYFNKIWMEYSGLAFEQLKDWGWKNIIHPDDWKENKTKWTQAIDSGSPFEVEHRFLNKEGIYKWHLSRGLAYKNEKGNIKMWVGTSTEIEEQKEQKRTLEKAVLSRTYDLNKAYAALEERNKELENINTELQTFAYVSSHDLQEPLRKIQTFSTRLLEKETENLSDNGKELFDKMQKAAMRMQTLIKDLLTYSRTSSADRKFEIIKLNVIIDEIKEDFKEEIELKKATIETGNLCEIKMIPFQFRQLVYNLVSNSLKFSNPENAPVIKIKSETISGRKTMAIKPLSPLKKYCHITYEDNGIGFEREYNEKVFEVFQQLHNKDMYQGTGIGLAIVKKIVENHKGHITASGHLNKGVRFDIYIPVTT